MKRLLALGALLLAFARPASAGLDLAWSNCATDGGYPDIALSCTQPSSARLLGSFQLNTTFPRFVALDVLLDIQTEDAPSGSFWHFGAGECNAGNLGLEAGHLGACTSAFPTMCSATGGECNTAFRWASNYRAASNRHRLAAAIYRPGGSSVLLTAGTNYFAFAFTFSTVNAVEGGGACLGCTDGTAIVWNSALASGFSAGANPEAQEEVLIGPGLVDNCATFNGAGVSLCGATPTRQRSWGQIKSLYR